MRINVGKLWKGALESPLDYPQSRDAAFLKYCGEFSPFGVLCEVYKNLKQGPAWGNSVEGIETFFKRSATLSQEVIEWAGLTEQEVQHLKGRSHREVALWLQRTQNQNQFLLR